MQEIISWIMQGPSWIQYRCLLDLLNADPNDPAVKKAKAATVADNKVKNLIAELENNWESALLKRHNDAAHPIHKLCFLADLGLNVQDSGISTIVAKIEKHRLEEGPFQVLSNFPPVFGGSGKDEWLWCLCDAPLIPYALMKMGMKDDPQVNKALDFLSSLLRENGWPCKACSQLGKFKGPGNASGPCPYANLIMIQALALRGTPSDLANAVIGAETALNLWEDSLNARPYLFKMGTNFRKLKVPFVWYDILHFADVLSQIPEFQNDKRFDEVLSIIQNKADENGRYHSESIWTKWKGWEFCQKKESSRWVTLCVLRILKRTGRWSFD